VAISPDVVSFVYRYFGYCDLLWRSGIRDVAGEAACVSRGAARNVACSTGIPASRKAETSSVLEYLLGFLLNGEGIARASERYDAGVIVLVPMNGQGIVKIHIDRVSALCGQPNPASHRRLLSSAQIRPVGKVATREDGALGELAAIGDFAHPSRCCSISFSGVQYCTDSPGSAVASFIELVKTPAAASPLAPPGPFCRSGRPGGWQWIDLRRRGSCTG
jgi:hypothetical protein